MTTEFILLRHGETEWNALGRLQGHLNSSLSREGLRQADVLSARLATLSFQALYSSDLDRAVQTAARIATRTGHDVRQDPRLRERGLGILEGLTRAEARERHPEVFATYAAGGPDDVIPQGESSAGRLRLARQCLEELGARHPDARVVVVTHGGVLSSLLRDCLGIPPATPRAFSVLNASWNQFDLQAGALRLVTWGDVNHLRGLSLDDT
ncbi:histidine phosphatase family protein [Corallococcus sp. BB11-1]|uniref:histidine phosphatase family protein n=1 Tax=Corallococcus sp. BB11-1 TaxID=2996783 RepID=UPI0010DF5069|nr:histidine phosphatase family protein [Corallococcus sp. BB11-1]MCY1035326.1 histidine phosphatase family protein [Corallococcus sp. BB11-1]RYZ45022.1 MAG: histidine phosphatase family protein [Myxococcaceae bacterium]